MSSIRVLITGFSGSNKVIQIEKNATISTLFQKVSEKIDVECEYLKLQFQGKEFSLAQDGNKLISDYKITDLKCVTVTSRMKGGMFRRHSEMIKLFFGDDINESRSKARWEQEAGHLVEKTLEPDIIYCDDDPNSLRWKMPCGHVMSQEGIKEHSKNEVKHGKVGVECPQCAQTWESSLIRALADMTLDEEIEFEVAIADNYQIKAKGHTKQCPGCQTICEREDTNDPRVVCRVCTKNTSSRYEFCWHCLGKWNSCSNNGCSGEDPALTKLRNCPMKTLLGQSGKFPSMRACPECHLLIEHIEGCKQMTCEKCKTKFCFICLKKAFGGNYQCGSYNSRCDVAPIQSDLFK